MQFRNNYLYTHYYTTLWKHKLIPWFRSKMIDPAIAKDWFYSIKPWSFWGWVYKNSCRKCCCCRFAAAKLIENKISENRQWLGKFQSENTYIFRWLILNTRNGAQIQRLQNAMLIFFFPALDSCIMAFADKRTNDVCNVHAIEDVDKTENKCGFLAICSCGENDCVPYSVTSRPLIYFR